MSTARAGRATYHGQLATTTTTLENTSSKAQLRHAADPANDGKHVHRYRATSDSVRCYPQRDVIGAINDASPPALPSALGSQVGGSNVDHTICTQTSRKQHATQQQQNTADTNKTPVSPGTAFVGIIDDGTIVSSIVSIASCPPLTVRVSNATGKHCDVQRTRACTSPSTPQTQSYNTLRQRT